MEGYDVRNHEKRNRHTLIFSIHPLRHPCSLTSDKREDDSTTGVGKSILREMAKYHMFICIDWELILVTSYLGNATIIRDIAYRLESNEICTVPHHWARQLLQD